MKKPELLAPVGNMESLIAAIEAGCDAVYLSGKKYGARAYANNFSNDEIKQAINYARMYGVKVYITVNTIIYENEVEDFLSYIDYLHKISVDAVIMQDIGMIDLVRKTYPNLEIHASTQMHIHNVEGVKFIEKLNIKRAVLARETSIETIKQIKQNTNTELEIFVHGALCISYSGLCLMSSMIGGRSGNRGMCAGCCRLPYDLISDNKKINKDKYLLSTKDLMTLENIGSLIELGIDSFKIEGRMKRPEYVYLVVSLYRKAIDSYIKNKKVDINEQDIKELKKIFNRGFTKGYLFNEQYIVNQKRPNHIGIEIGKITNYKNGTAYIKLKDELNLQDGIRIIGKKDIGMTITKMFKNNKQITKSKDGIITIKSEPVNINDIVVKTTDYNQLKEINNKIKEKRRKIKITGTITLLKGKNASISLSDQKNTITIIGEIVEQAINTNTTVNDIKKQIDRLGNTIYEFEKLDIKADNDIFIKISDLNKLRRNAIEKLNEKRIYKIEYKKEIYKCNVPNYKKINAYSYLSDDEKEIDINKYKYIYTDNYELSKKNNNIIYRIPKVNVEYKETNKKVLVGEIGSLYKYQNTHTDSTFNVVNSYSVAFLHEIGVEKITLSYELDINKTKDIIDNYHKRYNAHPNLEIIGKCYEEVMISKFNLLKYYNIKKGFLKDKFSNLYKIKIINDLMYIYNYKQRNIEEQKYFDIGINYIRINNI